jgi:arylsulfatase A-like enzyme
MFTGAHPGEHGYVGYGKAPGDKRPINPEFTTIPELLVENGYKNSALVSHPRILPEFGFGRGFHRFRYDGMRYSDWVTRHNDAKASVNQIIDWIEQDLAVRDHSVFYFLHIFDPHYPYIPPTERLDSPDVDFSKSRVFEEQKNEAQGDDWTYFDGYHNEYELEPELVQEIREWYSKSVEYSGDQIARFLQYLKAQNLFQKSLIIITGDHGEEFGERGFFTHTSLYDGNIRPFMAVKPPVGESWPEKNHVDTIDFLPTIAQLTGENIPEYCQGVPIQDEKDRNPRITERIYPDWYNLAVEVDGVKGIFTYDSDYPNRPTQDLIQRGPELTEFYGLSEIRKSDYGPDGIKTEQKNNLRQIAEEFLSNGSTSYKMVTEATRPPQETMEQLQNLGYK